MSSYQSILISLVSLLYKSIKQGCFGQDNVGFGNTFHAKLSCIRYPRKRELPTLLFLSHLLYTMQSPHLRLSTIPVQPSFHSLDVDIPEPPQTEAGKWTFHSQKEFPPPPPFEKRLRRYPTGAETGCCKCIKTLDYENKEY